MYLGNFGKFSIVGRWDLYSNKLGSAQKGKEKITCLKYHEEDLGLHPQGIGNCLQISCKKMTCQIYILESSSWK